MNSGPIQPNITTVLNTARFSGTETLVRIISLPTALQSLPQNTKLTGEVTQAATDGTAKIQTPEGEVVVQYPARRIPAEGQKLDIELPAGNPPQKAAVRPNAPPPENRQVQTDLPDLPTPSQPVVTRPDRPVASPPQSQTTQPSAPVTPEQRAALETVRAAIRVASTQAADLGSVVRLSPVSLSKLQVLIKSAETLKAKGAPVPEILLNLIKAATSQAAQPQPILQSSLKPSASPATPSTVQTPQQTQPALLSLFNDDATLKIEPSVFNTLQSSFTAVTGEDIGADFAKIILAKFASTISTSLTTPSFDYGVDVQIVRIGQLLQDNPLPARTTLSSPITALPLQPTAPLSTNTPLTSLENIRVIALTAENFPVILAQETADSPPSLFILQAPSPKIIPGTEIDLIPLAVQSFTAPQAITTSFKSFDWSALDQIFKALLGFDLSSGQTAATQTLVARPPLVLPNLANPQQLGPAALLFLAALRSGDFSGWLGEKNIDALKRANKLELITKLTDTATRARTASSDTVGDWRIQHLPMTFDGQILPLSIFYRQQQDENAKENESGKKQTRFIIDLSLNRMGPVQVDGLVRDKKLDIIIRTEAPLSEAMMNEMKKLYAGAVGQTSFTGDLAFQSRPDQFVKIEDSQAKQGLGVSA